MTNPLTPDDGTPAGDGTPDQAASGGSAPGTPSIDQIETRIAHDLARHALYVAPIATVAVGLWRGVPSGAAVALAFALVVANFIGAAWVLGWVARTSPDLLMGAAMMSFLIRLVLLSVIGFGIKELDIVDWQVFCITLVASYLGLLVWEMRSISLSLASPGLKPKPHEHSGVGG
jgi:hypothetical protein